MKPKENKPPMKLNQFTQMPRIKIKIDEEDEFSEE